MHILHTYWTVGKTSSKNGISRQQEILSQGDPRRMDSRNFPSHSPVIDEPPQMKTTDFIHMANSEYGRSVTSAEKKRIAQTTRCKGSDSLRRLPCHNRLDTPVDPMHLIKKHC